MVAICQTRYLVISPNPKDLEEKKAHFSSTRLNGVTSIDIDDEPSSDGENYAKEVDESFLDSKKLKYETDEDEAVKHSTPGNNGVSCSFRKRSFSEDSDSEDPSHYPNDYKTSSYVSSYERDSSAPDSRSRSSSNSKSRKMTKVFSVAFYVLIRHTEDTHLRRFKKLLPHTFLDYINFPYNLPINKKIKSFENAVFLYQLVRTEQKLTIYLFSSL